MPLIRAGDHVRHRPSGETWVVAYATAEHDELGWVGWPNGIAKLSDCELVQIANEDVHRAIVWELAQRYDDHRGGMVRALYGDVIPECATCHHRHPPAQACPTHGWTDLCPVVGTRCLPDADRELRLRVRDLERRLDDVTDAYNAAVAATGRFARHVELHRRVADAVATALQLDRLLRHRILTHPTGEPGCEDCVLSYQVASAPLLTTEGG